MGNARGVSLRMDAARLRGEDLPGQREGVGNEASDANNTRLCTFFNSRLCTRAASSWLRVAIVLFSGLLMSRLLTEMVEIGRLRSWVGIRQVS
jgi:hypothetical protein